MSNPPATTLTITELTTRLLALETRVAVLEEQNRQTQQLLNRLRDAGLGVAGNNSTINEIDRMLGRTK